MKNICILLFVATISAHAHNNLFFPGDAYFASSIQKSAFTNAAVTQPLSLQYVRYSTLFMSCGYAGCRNAEIHAVPAHTIKNLEKALNEISTDVEAAYLDYRNTSNEAIFPLLIYNKDFDFDQYPVGLKFNETSAEEQIKLAEREHEVDDRPDSANVRTMDTKLATKVRRLDVDKIPDDLTAFMGVEEPIIIDGAKVVFVILVNSQKQDLEDHITRQSGREIWVISDSIRKIKFD